MRSRRSTPTPELDEDLYVRMAKRVQELEIRVRLLEARIRELNARARAEQPSSPESKQKARAARTRPRPRCPGCLLEIPKGRRGETCVWCGFMFSAVGNRAFR